VKESIILTVSDREPEVLLSTFRWLIAGGLDESEVIIVNDNSRVNYSWMKTLTDQMNAKWLDLEPYECFKLDGNFNNPARAFNVGLAAAKGERVAILSSDVIVPTRVLAQARQQYDERHVWCPMVIDLESSMEYCGPRRVFPMPWFLYMSRDLAVRAGGWDENYLRGMCFEDNDFVGRLALTADQIVCDWTSCVWHQSHHQPAYLDNDVAKRANARNKAYTMHKWTGIPFGDSDQIAFEIARGRDETTGNFALRFKDIKGIKDKVLAETVSPFVKVPA
jgi:hypothetical protein